MSQNEPPKMSVGSKIGVGVFTALGVISSLAILAKTGRNKYSLNLKKMFMTPFKDTFLGKEEYKLGKVLAIGAGSCIGGYIGGLIFDKNKVNKESKKREIVSQYTNISLPIAFVAAGSKLGKFIYSKFPSNVINSNSKLTKLLSKTPEIALPMLGLGVGMSIANKFANKINQKIFKTNEVRPIEAGDLSAHLDDICLTAQYIAPKSNIVKSVSRIVPLALMVAGYEVGTRQEGDY